MNKFFQNRKRNNFIKNIGIQVLPNSDTSRENFKLWFDEDLRGQA